MEKIEAYKASDGTIFESAEECVDRERLAHLNGYAESFACLINEVYDDDFDYDSLLQIISVNRDYAKLIFQINKDINNDSQ